MTVTRNIRFYMGIIVEGNEILSSNLYPRERECTRDRSCLKDFVIMWFR